MGKSAVDLPDPLQQPHGHDDKAANRHPTGSAAGVDGAGGAGAGAGISSADDLLAQLADDEIDRLLSEAEVERSAPNAPAAAVEDAPVPPIKFEAATAPAPAVDESEDALHAE